MTQQQKKNSERAKRAWAVRREREAQVQKQVPKVKPLPMVASYGMGIEIDKDAVIKDLESRITYLEGELDKADQRVGLLRDVIVEALRAH